MVDVERLHRILRRVTDDLAVLRDYAALGAERIRSDRAFLGHVKYLFVTMVEGCVDAAQHVCASEGYGPPEDNADAVRLLGRHHLVADDVAEQIAKAVGLRNVLVHGYAAVDDDRVVANLDRLADVDQLVGQLTALLDS